MSRSRFVVRHRFAAACALVSLLTACSGGGSLTPSTSLPAGGTSGPASTSRFLQSAVTGTDGTPITYMVHPHPTKLNASVSPQQLPPPSYCEAAFGLACYSPQEIQRGYNVPPSLNGSGQTIVIVDAFGSPTIAQDLRVFDQEFGLPDTTLNVLYPVGQPPAFDPNNVTMASWASEITLDVEWSHAIAPGATIDLVISPDNSSTLDQAVTYAVRHHLGSVISLSWGAPEATISGRSGNRQLLADDLTYLAAALQGITILAAAGDSGATNGYATPDALFPASDPLITAVGGTDLFLADDGTYQSEYVWNDSVASQCPFGCSLGPIGATGGAPSVIFRAPPYQFELSHQRARTICDVAYNASLYTAVIGYIGFNSVLGPPGLYFFGGTSEGAPQWAGIVALANQARRHGTVGFMNPALYAIGENAGEYSRDFHDITVGNNGFFGPGFSAGPGYDLPTGLGTPNVANLIGDLTKPGPPVPQGLLSAQ
jgi:subtilase family serine protease